MRRHLVIAIAIVGTAILIAVVAFAEDDAAIDATLVLAVVLGCLLVALTHRWIRHKIQGS
jgi:cobalamin synthase